ncbi:MAG: hypothetical protein HZA93_15315 [Verrucomicrobia bacterium]|nr:hypothetical protein [Verrucomicrobiota bacterium]
MNWSFPEGVINIHRVSETKKRRGLPMSTDEVRTLFRASHLVLPAAGLAVIVGHLACGWKLSWEFLVVLGVVLLPFVLPLLGFYVGKIGVIEMANREIFENYESELVTAINEAPPAQPVVPPPQPPPQSNAPASRLPDPIAPDPSFHALTGDEQKVMRTLWKHQHDYIKAGNTALWGFVIGSRSPDYRSFVRGVHSLMQRKLVQQDSRGLVFLTSYGIGYADRNADLLDQDGDSWTKFEPAQ